MFVLSITNYDHFLLLVLVIKSFIFGLIIRSKVHILLNGSLFSTFRFFQGIEVCCFNDYYTFNFDVNKTTVKFDLHSYLQNAIRN